MGLQPPVTKTQKTVHPRPYAVFAEAFFSASTSRLQRTYAGFGNVSGWNDFANPRKLQLYVVFAESLAQWHGSRILWSNHEWTKLEGDTGLVIVLVK